MSSDPWLSGLLACSLAQDAEAIRAALHARGLKTRSVPAGRAKGAWTCVTDRGTLAVVIGGMGPDAARQAASFWMPRARWLVYACAGPGTGTVPAGTTILDGPHYLTVLAARGADAGATHEAKVAAVTEPVLGPAARATLSDNGYAAWDPSIAPWREACQAVGGVTLVCQGITTTDPERDHDLLQEVKDGQTGRPWWRTAAAYVLPGTRRAHRQADERHQRAIQTAARCAVAALLGPAQP